MHEATDDLEADEADESAMVIASFYFRNRIGQSYGAQFQCDHSIAPRTLF
jgi:hypothetical protein